MKRPRTRRSTISLTRATLDKLATEAAEHGMSTSGYAHLLLHVHLRAGSIAALEKRVATLEGQ